VVGRFVLPSSLGVMARTVPEALRKGQFHSVPTFLAEIGLEFRPERTGFTDRDGYFDAKDSLPATLPFVTANEGPIRRCRLVHK
jgi:hypothetical protein